MKKILALTISSLFLVACGGGGSGSSDNRSNNEQPSLSDISATWDAKVTVGEEVDEIYLVIKDHGEMVLYDYDGDSYDDGSDCYYKYSVAITDLGDGFFEIYGDVADTHTVKLEISDSQLFDGVDYMPESSLKESDFVPLCSDYSMSAKTAKDLPEMKQKGVLSFFNQSN